MAFFCDNRDDKRSKEKPSRLSLQELKVRRFLGKGATGTVFLVNLKRTEGSGDEETLALKLLAKDTSSPEAFCNGNKRRARIENEIEILSSLPNHPLLPLLFGRVETPTLVGFAVEYCPGGDLHRLRQLQPDGMFSDSAIRFYAAEVTLALEDLHSHGIVYRDLKPENILVRRNGHIMLADFDLSLQITRPQSGTNSVAGTDEYMAPEMVSGRDYGTQVDLWCLGILLYEMSYGKTPFRTSSKDETFRRIVRMAPPVPPATANRPLNDLISKLLRKDPRRRATLSDVKSHRFFAGLCWESVTNLLRPPFLPEEEEDEEEKECGRWVGRKEISVESLMFAEALQSDRSTSDSSRDVDEDAEDGDGLFS